MEAEGDKVRKALQLLRTENPCEKVVTEFVRLRSSVRLVRGASRSVGKQSSEILKWPVIADRLAELFYGKSMDELVQSIAHAMMLKFTKADWALRANDSA